MIHFLQQSNSRDYGKPRWHQWPSAEKSDQVLTLDLIIFVLQYVNTARSRGTCNTNQGTFRAMRKSTLKSLLPFPYQKPLLVKAFPRKDVAIQGNKWDRYVWLLLLCLRGSMLPTSLPWLGCFGTAGLPSYKQLALLLFLISHLHLISILQDKDPPGQEHSYILLHEHHLEHALFPHLWVIWSLRFS